MSSGLPVHHSSWFPPHPLTFSHHSCIPAAPFRRQGWVSLPSRLMPHVLCCGQCMGGYCLCSFLLHCSDRGFRSPWPPGVDVSPCPSLSTLELPTVIWLCLRLLCLPTWVSTTIWPFCCGRRRARERCCLHFHGVGFGYCTWLRC